LEFLGNRWQVKVAVCRLRLMLAVIVTAADAALVVIVKRPVHVVVMAAMLLLLCEFHLLLFGCHQ
jgi:hypothetical protein